MTEYFFNTWAHREFTEASELEEYLDEIRPIFTGQPLTKIMMMGLNYNTSYREANSEENSNIIDNNIKESYDAETDGSKTEDAKLWVDEPLVFIIGDNRLEIDEPEECSNISIGINQLDFTERSYQCSDNYNEEYEEDSNLWKDISIAYSKNCINQIVEDIYINKTKYVSTFGDNNCMGYDGDDMFYEFCIRLQSGYEIVFSKIWNYTLVRERKYFNNRELLEKENNEGYEDWHRYFKPEIDKKSFFKQVDNSTPQDVSNFKIESSAKYDWLMFKFNIKTNIGESSLHIPGYTEEINKLILLLESIVIWDETQQYRHFDENGFNTFIYTEIVNENYIRFVQLSNRNYNNENNEQTDADSSYEPVTLRCDIIVDRKLFVKEFYNAYKKIVDIDKTLVDEKYIDDFDSIIKHSELIEEYLAN